MSVQLLALVYDGVTAAVIDPQRDIDRVLDVLDVNELELAAVFETHVHNDYVTGGYELARRTEAAYHLNAEEKLDFDAVPVRDGDEINVGSFFIRVLHTPGHTPTHLSYVANGSTTSSTPTPAATSSCRPRRTDRRRDGPAPQRRSAPFPSARSVYGVVSDGSSPSWRWWSSACMPGDIRTSVFDSDGVAAEQPHAAA